MLIVMIRIAALIAGLLLVVCPALWLLDAAVPLPKYRKGAYADYVFLGQALLAIYGGVLLGVAVYFVHATQTGQPLFPTDVFKAGMFGMLAVCTIFFLGGSLYGIAKYGSFEKAIDGNLWGAVVIFWGPWARSCPAGTPAGAGQGATPPPRLPPS
jgi:hypothetical protein